MPPTHLLTRLFFTVTIPCVLLLTLAITAIRGQMHHSSDLRILFMPSACSAPCFLGIEPGQTTLTAGVDLLRTNSLVQSVSPVVSESSSPSPSGLYDVEFLQTQVPWHRARVQFLSGIETGIIESILLLKSDIQLSDIVLTFGQSPQFVLDDRFHLGLATYVAFYPQYKMYVQVVVTVCTPNEEIFWNQRQSIVIGIESSSRYAQQSNYYPADAHQSGGGWLQQLHDLTQRDCT